MAKQSSRHWFSLVVNECEGSGCRLMKEIPSTLADGIYTLTSVYLMDSVGNAAYAEVASGNRLVVDKTPPVIENIVVHGGTPVCRARYLASSQVTTACSLILRWMTLLPR